MNTYVYTLGDALYINLTNQCTNRCEFCVRNLHPGVGGYDLWLDKEPTAQEVIERIGDPSKYSEVVFCGYGEPMVKLDEIIAIARVLKEKGTKIRINTNGQANLYHGKNIVPLLEGLVDVVSISLNAPTAEKYQEICHSIYGVDAFDAVLDFARECAKVIPKVVFTVVDLLPPEDMERCRRIADEIGVELRVRKLME
ncbi:MAG: radical SAM protein [Clostridiales bacterium]|nr:radical SAM protein [Clostridiales bacterium]